MTSMSSNSFNILSVSPVAVINILQINVFTGNTPYTGPSKKMDEIWNRYNLKSTRTIYTFSVLKCYEKFKDLDSP